MAEPIEAPVKPPVPTPVYTAEMESDDEDLDELPRGQPASNLAQKRRTQEAMFESWLTSDTAQEALKPRIKESKLLDLADDELSIQSLINRQGTEIIKCPRDYQLELFERAKRENTIAVLDTGSGKTLIAVLLLRWIIDQELEDRAALKPPRISFFLVSSVTLVYQQYSVLETNLDHKVARVCGADNTDNWNKSKWSKLFEAKKIIVCTGDVLHHCLSHSFITMKAINLLIFDEAHHAKKNHPYARIIKDFYLSEPDKCHRPRVFGMTASPVDAKTDVMQAATELETILHSRIATTLDMSLVNVGQKTAEQTLCYATLRQPFQTLLLQAFSAQFGDVGAFKHIFTAAPEIARQLGAWCADQYVVDELSEKKLREYELKLEKKFHAHRTPDKVEVLDSGLAELRAAFDFVEKEHTRRRVTLDEQSSTSSKVRDLQKYLACEFELSAAQRCIVFVNERKHARLLARLFGIIGSKHMRSGFLVGGNSSDPGEEHMSFKDQVLALVKFRKGDTNCLFATTVAEEGLDIPDCNLIIRFSLYTSMIQYVQSRGRARQRNSKFLHMVEKNNSVEKELVLTVRYEERAMRKFCQALPEDRRLIGNEDSLEGLMAKEKSLRVYTEESTGAKLTYGNALAYLANFVSAIPTETDEPQHPTYVVSYQREQFLAEVILPANAPIPSAIGRVCTKKTLAKRSAAFEACCELRKRGLIDEHFVPTYQKRLPAMRNALLAVGMKDTGQYPMRTKPSIWEETRGSLPTELWVTIIDFPDGLERKHQPLALVTRTPMPEFPAFPIFLNDGRASRVTSQRLQVALKIEGDMIQKLSAFTFRVFKDVFSKTYEEGAAQLSYWLAPAVVPTTRSANNDPYTAIDWLSLNTIFESDEFPWTPETPNDFLLNRFLVDKWDGGRKFRSIAIAKHLNPSNAVPADTAKGKYNDCILGYSVSLYKESRKRAVWNLCQPVMETEKFLARRNMLAAPAPKEVSLKTKAYLCPLVAPMGKKILSEVDSMHAPEAVAETFDPS